MSPAILLLTLNGVLAHEHASSGADEQDAMSAHMAHMEEVRQALRTRLGPGYDAAVPEGDAGAGAKLFATICIACHGPSGKGDGPAAASLDPHPPDLTDPVHARFYSDAGRLEIIRDGVPLPGSPMVGFGAQLDERQLLDLYAFLRSIRGPEPSGAEEHEHHHHHDD